MTEEALVDAMCEVLRTRVAPLIKLKKANDQNVHAPIEYVHPGVYPVYIPFRASGYDPKSMKEPPTAPHLVVMPGDLSEDLEGAVQLMHIAATIYDPGTVQAADEDQPDELILTEQRTKAWRSMSTICEIIRRELQRKRYLGGAVIDYPIKYGAASSDSPKLGTWPYCIGVVEVPIRIPMERALPDGVHELIN